MGEQGQMFYYSIRTSVDLFEPTLTDSDGDWVYLPCIFSVVLLSHVDLISRR